MGKARVGVGSFYIEADTKEELLEAINYDWNHFYNKEWNSGRFWYDILKHVNDTYFNDNFKMTRSEAKERLEQLDYRGLNNEVYVHVKLKLAWYVKYGQKAENSKQLNIYDYLENKVSGIPELEEEILDEFGQGNNIVMQNWGEMVTPNTLIEYLNYV